MLLRVCIKNFLSFDEEMQFDMFPNIKRTTLQEHIYTEGKVPLLKQAAIYGANAAGKSNVVKAVEFIKAFATDKDFLKNIEVEKYLFLLKEENSAPISISMEFELQQQYFFYVIEILPARVSREVLYETFPQNGEVKLVFERKDSNITYAEEVVVDEGIKNATKSMLAKNPHASFLALNREFPLSTDRRVSKAYTWIKNHLEVIGIHSVLPTIIDLFRTKPEVLRFTQELITKLEIGAQNIDVITEDFDRWAQNHIKLAGELPSNMDQVQALSLSHNSTPLLSISIENGIRKVYQMMFEAIGKQGYVGHLSASSQSDGTLRVLILLPALYLAMKKGKTIVVDEINFCLSPTMVKGLVQYFAQTKGTNGQLIFTTHDVQLLDEKRILRSDEVWFVDKKDGASLLYNHNEFKEHNTISMMRGYNEGRYGAIRFVNLGNHEEAATEL